MKVFARKTGFGNGHKWEAGIGDSAFGMSRGIRISKGGYKIPFFTRYRGIGCHISIGQYCLSILGF